MTPDTPPTPRPKRAAKPAKGAPREPVTPVSPDTPPDMGAGPGNISEAAAAAAGKPSPGVKRGGATGGSPSPRRPRNKADRLQQSLTDMLSAPALVYAAAGDEWAAEFVASRAPVMAEAWVHLAEEHTGVRRVLEKITTGSAWGGVILATGGTVLPLLSHHNLLPDLGLPIGTRTEEGSTPIVPPPPAAGPPPPGPATNGRAGVGRTPPVTDGDMTPPTKAGQPPGVVTVAGTNNQAAA